ncbi:MAG: branched chain amino acid aminotransferase [Bacteroidetes bacterium RIFCSPLOWO2_12_FULL_35_15]|nr:MAG: branched chain amino acid aminotransferase [Bacteroidetes bacterium RIFCSPLOWO2_12_FULL_35_15]
MVTADTFSIKVQKTSNSRLSELDFNHLSFGKTFADHMFISDYQDGHWIDSQILPYGSLTMSPANSALHYGQSIFEGMKAYKNDKGEVSLFRPLENQKRINISAERMCMPSIPEELFMDALKQLIKLDKGWVPSNDGASLYIRPFLFATDEFIGVRPSDTYKFMIITSPGGAYYSEPVKVLIETNFIRAVEGGVGFTKCSGNYGRSLFPTKLAQQRGYQQIMWTDARNHRYLEESGTMNLMFVIDDVLITPALGDTILAGITRDSVITLARDWKMKVQERKISIDEVIDAHKRGVLDEAFGTGTAATIADISTIGFEGKDYVLPEVKERIFSNRVAQELNNIKRGKVEDKHNWMYKIG